MICASIWMVDLWLETSENCEERASTPLKLIVRMMQKFLYSLLLLLIVDVWLSLYRTTSQCALDSMRDHIYTLVVNKQHHTDLNYNPKCAHLLSQVID